MGRLFGQSHVGFNRGVVPSWRLGRRPATGSLLRGLAMLAGSPCFPVAAASFMVRRAQEKLRANRRGGRSPNPRQRNH